MGIFRQFPYSNFHDMNMDEIIKIVKNMLEEWAQYYAEWDAWMAEINDDWSNYQEVMNEAWQNMQDFINNYFDNLDVQNEINNKITSMVSSGEFATIVEPYIPPRVTAWLAEHITEPVGVVIDTSLSVAGAAADAKAAGDAINYSKYINLSVLDDIFKASRSIIPTAYISSEGVITSGGVYDTWCYQVVENTLIDISVSDTALSYAFYANMPVISAISYDGTRHVINDSSVSDVLVPAGCAWVAIRTNSGGTAAITPKSVIYNNIVGNIEELADNIEDKNSVYRHNFEFALYQWTPSAGNLPTVGSSVSRFRTTTFYKFRKGETISVKWSNLQLFPIYCDENGICSNIVTTWSETLTFANDCYCYFNFKNDNVSNFTNFVDQYGYFVHMVNTENSHWNGKSWYCFGSSMSDIDPNGTTGNNGTNGKYPLVVDELSGLIRTNEAIGSGGICPSAPHGGNVKDNIMDCPYDVDLVTLECGLNDWGSVTLGNIGDTSDDTFIGNFTQCIEYLTYNTRAKIVLITMVGTTFTDSSQTTRRSPFFKNSFGYYYRDYIDAMIKICEMYGVEVIDAEAHAMSNGRLNKWTVKDSIHFTYLGGQVFGRYVWDKLKDILEMPNIKQSVM